MKKLFLLSTYVFTMMAIVFGMQSCATSPIDTKKLEGYWVLDQIDGISAKEAFKGPQPTLEFNFTDSLVAGSAGCNRYLGKFEITDKNAFLAPNIACTMMMCGFENKESEFIKALSSSLTLSLDKKGMLTFTDKDGNVVLRFAQGGNTLEEKVLEPITLETLVGKWTMNTLVGETVKKNDRELFIEFTLDGTVNGNAGCNNYRSKIELGDNNQLVFGPIASTRMGCPELDQETMFLTLLEEPVQAVIENNVLAFIQNGVTIAQFSK